MSDPAPTVYLVDDDVSVLRGLGRLLAAAGMKVAAFDSPREFLGRLDPAAPGCLILDVAMPGLNGLELQQALAARGSALPVVFLTGRGDIPMSVQAMKRGAADFLTKPVDDEMLLATIRNALEKNRASRGAREELAQVEKRLAKLTAREREVLERVVTGRLNKQIAAELGTVEKTIKVHRAHVMQKMGVRTLADLVRLAGRAGIRTGRG
ncbi:MAG: response regulator transcription factor [Betaproteobacteria bacterium]|nr:MAG: response regulator transcription factor [Betaproteobacteria bacterium]